MVAILIEPQQKPMNRVNIWSNILVDNLWNRLIDLVAIIYGGCATLVKCGDYSKHINVSKFNTKKNKKK